MTKAQRFERYKEQAAKFPCVWLPARIGDLRLNLDPENPWVMSVGVNGDRFSIDICDPKLLGEFIAALIMRYNALVEEMNRTASLIVAKRSTANPLDETQTMRQDDEK